MKTMNIRIRRAYNNFIEIHGSFSWRHEKNVLESLRTWHKLYVVVGRSDAVRVHQQRDGVNHEPRLFSPPRRYFVWKYNTILDLNN